MAPHWVLHRVQHPQTPADGTRYYLGITPSRLEHYYARPGCVSRSSKLFACMIVHLFDADYADVDHKTTSTYRLLSAVADRPPRHTPVEYHLATSRFLLGDGLADRLGLPPTGRLMAFRVWTTMGIEWMLPAFGRIWFDRWEVERVACTRTLVSMIVCWQLGSRRTRFTIKSFGADTVLPQVVEKEGAERKEVVEEKEVDPDDDELDPEVQVGPVAGKRIIARWRWLLLEMMGVMVSPMVVVGVRVLYWRWRT